MLRANVASTTFAISHLEPSSNGPLPNSSKLAAEARLPVFLHQRDAHQDFVAILRGAAAAASGRSGSLLHRNSRRSLMSTSRSACISVSLAGSTMSVAAASCRELVTRIPAERLMLETDGPYLLPRDLEPKPATRRNEPMYLPHILATVASLRGERCRCACAPDHRQRASLLWLAQELSNLSS